MIYFIQVGVTLGPIKIGYAENPAELVYRLGPRPLHARIHGGHWC